MSGLLGAVDEEALALVSKSPPTNQPKPIKVLRERHHALARLLAAGKSNVEAAAIVGYDANTVSVLKRDQAFADLLEFYKDKVNVVFIDTLEQMRMLSNDALSELHERLENEPESFSHKELMGMAEMTLDRTGHGKSATVNHNVTNVTDETLLRIKQAASERISGVQEVDTINQSSHESLFDLTPETNSKGETVWSKGGGEEV